MLVDFRVDVGAAGINISPYGLSSLLHGTVLILIVLTRLIAKFFQCFPQQGFDLVTVS